jgi:ABC-type bacteriocin/lantibiotic exporter with double-glycine peptidase domain
MPRLWRSVSQRSQRSQADCLPIAVQMVASYLGYDLPYESVYDLLGTQWYGTPFRHLERLSELRLRVSIEHLGTAEIAAYIEQDLPVIAGVQTAPLPYWSQAADHVVVVVGVETDQVYLHDPSLSSGPQAVPRTAFELAQLDFDNLCAIITKEQE